MATELTNETENASKTGADAHKIIQENLQKEMDELGLKKKKRVKKLHEVPANTSSSNEEKPDGNLLPEIEFLDDPQIRSTGDEHTYDEMLLKIYMILDNNNPQYANKEKKYVMIPPSVMRDGPKKSVFANMIEICKRMNRQPDHLMQFIMAELGTTASIDGSQRLVIKGKYVPKQIEGVLKRYIVEYVTCKMCKSPNTEFTKENRLFFVTCNSCSSKRTVLAIKTGFKAQTERRAIARNAGQ